MKKIFALTTIVVLLAVVIPASAAPTIEKQCEIWFGMLQKIPETSLQYNRVRTQFEEQGCGRLLDRLALVALYESTDGDNWDTNYNWLSDIDHCFWYLVYCDDLDRVKKLDLYWNQLSGEIPAELGYLSNLDILDLSSNQLSGEIPAELGNLSNLTRLRLFDNQLSGEIPAELGYLSNLYALWLVGNQLSGEIPAELGYLSNLRILDLTSNQLSGEIPAELGNLSSLEYLYLTSNQLSGAIPTKLRNLSNLSFLYLHYNDESLCVSTQNLLSFFQDLAIYYGPDEICSHP